MAERKEIIRLDARLVGVLPPTAFVGELANGHRVVAYFEARDRVSFESLKPGTVVTVDMSPFDMSKGRIVGCDGEDTE